MIKRSILFLALPFLFYNSLLFSVTVDTNFKIAYIDVDYVFTHSPLKVKLETAYSEQISRFLNYRQKLEADLLQIKQDLDSLRTVLGYTEFIEVSKDYLEKKKLVELELIAANKEFKAWEKENQAIFIEEFYRVVKAYAIDKKIKIVFSKKVAIVSSSDDYDISDRIISLLEEVNTRDLPTIK